MNPRAIFGINVLMSLTSSIVAAALFAWPWLRVANGEQALLWLVTPHMFLCFIGLSFLVPGVVPGSLSNKWGEEHA
jgi:polyferredoxin